MSGMADAVSYRMDCIVTVSGTGSALLHGDLVFMYVSFKFSYAKSSNQLTSSSQY